MQISIFSVILCAFRNASCQFHHSNYLKVGKIPATPQHACVARCGTAFSDVDAMGYVQEVSELSCSGTFGLKNGWSAVETGQGTAITTTGVEVCLDFFVADFLL